MDTLTKIRLDELLVLQHGYQTRSRARDAIKRGCVRVGDKIIYKPGQVIEPGKSVEIRDEASAYVSRAALKLVHALNVSGINPAGKIALDLGASTGGFSQVLLERGAKRVIAIDVGSGQLHESLADHPRLTNIENLNVRHLTSADLEGIMPEIITSDLSFISLKIALPPALDLAADGAFGIFLVKPQFEVGREGLGSGGVVRDHQLVQQTVEDLAEWLGCQPGWEVVQSVASPISGGDGNAEYLMIGRKKNG
jgi:23S rRNA (cytidine1920-2'-O)/16S rRNA (cytidine1409-2'-O)-methyltransferase